MKERKAEEARSTLAELRIAAQNLPKPAIHFCRDLPVACDRSR